MVYITFSHKHPSDMEPASAQCWNNVETTSMQRNYVASTLSTLFQRSAFRGKRSSETHAYSFNDRMVRKYETGEIIERERRLCGGQKLCIFNDQGVSLF